MNQDVPWYKKPIRCYDSKPDPSRLLDGIPGICGNTGNGLMPTRHYWPDHDTQRADLAAMLPGLAAVLAR